MSQVQVIQAPNHTKNHKKWAVTDDLHLLKNWSKEDHTLGTELQRTTGAISVRRSYLRNHNSRVKVIATTFPHAELMQIEDPRKDRTDKKSKKHNKTMKTSKKGIAFANFHVPAAIEEKYSSYIHKHKNGYSLKELLFIAANTDKKDSYIGVQIGRTQDAISVQKSKVKRLMKDSSYFLYKALQEMSDTPQAIIAQKPQIAKTKANIRTIGGNDKVFVVNFNSFEVDQENKRIIFKLD